MAPYSGHMLEIVARSARLRLSRPGPKNSTNFSTTPCLRNIRVTASTRSVAVTPSARLPVRRTPITSGIAMYIGWPSIAASASMPPTPQPSTPTPLIMVVCESVPSTVSGKAIVLPLALRVCTTLARYSRFTWCTIPVAGGTTVKLSKASEAHLRNS